MMAVGILDLRLRAKPCRALPRTGRVARGLVDDVASPQSFAMFPSCLPTCHLLPACTCAEQYRTDWSRQAGLPASIRAVAQPPDQSRPSLAVISGIAPALMLDTGSLILSAVGDAAWLGCTVATRRLLGRCPASSEAPDIIVTVGFVRILRQSSIIPLIVPRMLDLVVALTDLSASVLPGFGETSGVPILDMGHVSSLGFQQKNDYLEAAE